MYNLQRASQEDIQAMREISWDSEEYNRDPAGFVDKHFKPLPTRGITKPVLLRYFVIVKLMTSKISHSLRSGRHEDRTDSAASFAVASMWLNNCIIYHPECNADKNYRQNANASA
jgi:hypothetical protein